MAKAPSSGDEATPVADSAAGSPEPTPKTGIVATAPAKTGTAVAPRAAISQAVVEMADTLGVSVEEYLASVGEIDNAIHDNIEDGEIQVSRIGIAQPTSPKVAGGEEGWQGGMLFDNMGQEVITLLGKAPWLLSKGIPAADLKAQPFLPFVPIFKLPNEYVLWPSKDERAAGIKRFHWKTLDGTEARVREGMWPPKGNWVGEGSPPVTEHLNILGIGLNEDGTPRTGLIVASFSRTSFQTGKKLITACVTQKTQQLPFFGRVYYLFTDKLVDKKTNATYYAIQFAKGPKLLEFGSNREATSSLFREAFAAQKKLSDATNGKYLQELYINAAQLGDADAHGAASEGGEKDLDDVGGATHDPNF